jgi:hypothetical protein
MAIVNTTPYIESSVSGVTFDRFVGPDYIDVYALVGTGYSLETIEFGTKWYPETSGVQTAFTTNEDPVSIAAAVLPRAPSTGTAQAFAQSAFAANKAAISTDSTETSDARATASSTWGKPLDFNFASPPAGGWVWGSITLGVEGSFLRTGDSEASWSYRFEFNPADTPGDDDYFGSVLTVGGGADQPVFIPPIRQFLAPGSSVSSPDGDFIFANQGTAPTTDLQFTLAVRLFPGVSMLTGSLVMEAESPADRTVQVPTGGGAWVDLDGNGSTETFAEMYQADLEDTAEQGEVSMNFANTARIVSITLPAGVTVNTLDGSAIPFGVISAPIPEPGTWALMAVGLLGVAGYAAQRRTKATV